MTSQQMIERLRERANEKQGTDAEMAAWLRAVANSWERDLESGDPHGLDRVSLDGAGVSDAS